MPELTLEAMEAAKAFKILNNTRGGNGFTMNPIGLSDIREYIAMFGDPWIGTEAFIQLITEMDVVFRDLVAESGQKKADVKTRVIDKRGTGPE